MNQNRLTTPQMGAVYTVALWLAALGTLLYFMLPALKAGAPIPAYQWVTLATGLITLAAAFIGGTFRRIVSLFWYIVAIAALLLFITSNSVLGFNPMTMLVFGLSTGTFMRGK